ncbi:MAG TPA: hypothetical protein VFW95_04205 [Candidatus Limnocylindria bacterium]|nr:hypothetical protein [Candidatus Limnocylindria bacterium]
MRVTRTVVTVGGIVAALVAAWFIPVLAVAVVWPLLLVVPGLGVLAAVRPRIDAAGRLGLAIVISVAISTHLVYWLSFLAGGYGRDVVFAAAAVLSIPIPLAVWTGKPLASLRVGPALLSAATIAALALLVVGVTLDVGIWRLTTTGVTSGGSNWSDLGVHLSIAQTLNAGGNFPPDVPYFAGEPLVYHWFADFHAAILAEAAGMFSVPAMVVQSAILAASLAFIVWSLARRLVRGHRAMRVATIAAALVVFGGGLGYVRFVGDVTAGVAAPLELIRTNSYDNQWLTGWPYFRIPSVMGTGLLAHRATTAGLPLLAGAILLFVAGLPTAAQRASGWRDRRAVIALAGLLGALLAPFHFFFFPIVPLLALAWAVTGRRVWDRDTLRNVAAFGLPYLTAIPFIIGPLIQASGSGALRWVGVWQSAPVADGIAAVVFFYATNLGLPFALALVALFMPRVPRAAFLGTWLVACFLIPNLVQVSVIDFDMNKYFQAMWIAAGILAAWLIHRWPVPAIAAVVLLSIPSPLLVAGWTATSNLQILTSDELAAADWVAENTPPEAVFVTDSWISSLTDAAGRRRLTSFPPYIANLGFQPDQRVADVQSIYCAGDAAQSAELMRRYGATYVVDGNRPQPCVDPVDFATDPAFELVYDASPRIWRLGD